MNKLKILRQALEISQNEISIKMGVTRSVLNTLESRHLTYGSDRLIKDYLITLMKMIENRQLLENQILPQLKELLQIDWLTAEDMKSNHTNNLIFNEL